MILIFHITVALGSLAAAGFSLVRPSKPAINLTCILTVLMFASGLYLVFKTPLHMVQTCTEGLIYLGVILGATIAAKRKLNRQSHDSHPVV